MSRDLTQHEEKDWRKYPKISEPDDYLDGTLELCACDGVVELGMVMWGGGEGFGDVEV